MKVIFLDIDGVLATNKQFFTNTANFWKKNEWARELKVPYPFDKGCVDIFNSILEQTDAEIVLSSDWKLHWDLIDLDTIFKENGVNKSPRFLTKNEDVSMTWIERNRAYQIGMFIQDFNITDYVVIDDLDLHSFMETRGDDKNFIQTRSDMGLKQQNIKEKIIKVLTK